MGAFSKHCDADAATLDTLRLAVYETADGTLFFREDGMRVRVHGNTRWTTSPGQARRGHMRTSPTVSRQDSLDSSETSGSDGDEGDGPDDSEADDRRQLAEAIAASVAGQAGPMGSGPSAVHATAAARNDAEEREQIEQAMAASLRERDDLGSGGHAQALRCSHSFHRACISRWLRSSRTCPTCRERA